MAFTGIFRTIKLLYHIGRIYGLSTFTYSCEQNNRAVNVKWWDVLLLVFFVIFYTVLFVMNQQGFIKFIDTGSLIFNKGMGYLLTYSFTSVLYSVVTNFLFRNKLWNILVKIDCIDQKVSGCWIGD